MKFRSSILFLLLLKVPQLPSWDPEFLLNKIELYTKLGESQEFLLFICAKCKDDRIDNFIVRLYQITGNTQYVTTNYTDYQLRHCAKRLYWALVFTYSVDDPIFQIHDYSLRGWHFYLGAVVFLSPIDDFVIVREMLLYLYKKHFTNTLLYYASSNLTNNFFGFRTYPKFTVDVLHNNIEKLHVPTMHGYAIKTPLQIDMPRVFKFQDLNGRTQVQGISYRIFNTFIDFLNGTIKEYPMNNGSTKVVNMKEVMQLIVDEKIDMSAHAYAFISRTDVDQSYPLAVVRWCVIVPSFNQITSYFYPLTPLAPTVWILYLISTLSFIMTSYCYQKMFQKNVSFSKCFLVGLCLMINSAAPRRFENISKWEFFLLSIVLFPLGFITYSYTSFLGSILTVNLFRQQINTIEDLINAKIPLMGIDFELELLRNMTQLLPEFEKLLIPVDPETHANHRNVLNTSYAYLATDDQWHFLNSQQKYLTPPKFRLTDICFGSFQLVFPIQIDSPLSHDLEYFIFRIHASGLYQHYQSIAYDHAVEGGFAQRFTSPSEYPAAGMKHLLIAFQLLGVLWGLSLIVFICEVVFKKKK